MKKAESSKSLYRAFRRETREALDARLNENAGSVGDRGARRGYLREYIRWLRPFAPAVIAVCAFAIVAASLSLILPRATMFIIDKVLPAGDRALLHKLGWGLAAIILVQQTCDLLRNWRTAKLNARIVFRLRQKLYNHLLNLPLHELAAMKTGGITSRLSGDIDSISGLVQIAIITPGVAGFKVILTIVILFWISWKMSVAALILLPLVVSLNLMHIRRIRPIYRSMRRDRGEIDGRVVETFGGVRVVRAFSRERTEARRYAVRHHAVIRKHLLAQLYQHIVWSGWGFVIPLAGLIIIWFGGTLYLSGDVSIGGIVAFQLYLMMLLMPVSAIVKSYGELQQALAAMERIFDLLRRLADKPDQPNAVAAPATVETFEFDDVTFSYPAPVAEDVAPVAEDVAFGAERSVASGPRTGRNVASAPRGRRSQSEPAAPARVMEPVLRSFSLTVPGGATVALVGPSGAGKTTVTNLVARFYDPDEGAVRLNGVDLRDIKLAGYRKLIGLVQQDVFLFDGTIAENIAYGKPHASAAEIENSAWRANAHDFITSFPDAYETLVGERGVRLSGGQAQRVSIARVILADPQILILDEATSSLDSESEQLIQASMENLLADRTTFVIAHRLSTVINADLIVVLIDGRIVETGTHEQLMSAAGAYREMIERQQRGLAGDLQPADWLT